MDTFLVIGDILIPSQHWLVTSDCDCDCLCVGGCFGFVGVPLLFLRVSKLIFY